MSIAAPSIWERRRSGDGATRAMAVVSVVLMMLMQVLDSTIANVALPHIQGSVSAGPDQINWVLTSYIVAAAILGPTTGWVARRFGRRRLLIASGTLFVVASVLCGLSQSLIQIVLFRIIQGIAGAPFGPLCQAQLLDQFPKRQHGTAMALFGVGVMIGPIAGPILGGWLTENFSWRWVFFINIPIGFLAVAGVIITVRETARDLFARFDWTGFATLGLAVGALQLMLDRGQELDWFGSPEILVETVLALLGLYLFIVHFLTTDRPMLPRALFADRNFCAGAVVYFLIGVLVVSALVLMTQYLQGLMGYPVLTAGIAVAPRGIGSLIGMVLAARSAKRFDPRLVLMAGLLLTAWSFWRMSHFTTGVSEAVLMEVGLLQGVGTGFFYIPASTLAFSTLPSALRTDGGSFLFLTRNVGASIGIALLAAQLEQSQTVTHAELSYFINPFARLLPGEGGTALSAATHGGAAALADQIDLQAAIVSYNDVYTLLTVVTLMAIPLLLLFRRPAAVAADTVVHVE